MRDNDLIRVFLPIINSGIAAAGLTGVTIKQANQPTAQGANTNPTIYFFKVSDHRYGFLDRRDVWDEINEVMIHTEVQQYETVFQFSALVRQNPRTPVNYTASDLVNECAAILQSDVAMTQLFQNDIGILKITDIRNPYFTDDRDQYEASPSFDVTFTHKQTRVSTVPVIESVEYNVKRI